MLEGQNTCMWLQAPDKGHCYTALDLSLLALALRPVMTGFSGRQIIECMHMAAGSRWSNKRALDEDRPLGRGMRIKQEPAYIQDPAILTGLVA